MSVLACEAEKCVCKSISTESIECIRKRFTGDFVIDKPRPRGSFV